MRKNLLFAFVVLVVVLAYSYALLTAHTQGPPCYISGQGYAVDVHVVSDISSKPVAGASVSGFEYTYCYGGGRFPAYTYSQSIPSSATSSNGTESFAPIWEGYSITVHYSSHAYTFTLNVAPTRILNATLSVPSGNLNITSINPP